MDQPAADLGALEAEYRRSWFNIVLTLALAVLGLVGLPLVIFGVFLEMDRLGIPGWAAWLIMMAALLFPAYPLLVLRLWAGVPAAVRVCQRGVSLFSPGRRPRSFHWEQVREVVWSHRPVPVPVFGKIWSVLVDSPWCLLTLADGTNVTFSDVTLRRADLWKLVDDLRRHTAAITNPPAWVDS
jgi:hypothetical protein